MFLTCDVPFFIDILMCIYCRCSSVITFLSDFAICVLHLRVSIRIYENNIGIDCMEIQYRTYVFWTGSVFLCYEIPFGRLQTGRDEKEATERINVVLLHAIRFVIYINKHLSLSLLLTKYGA